MPNSGAPPLSGETDDRDDRRIGQVVAAYLRTHPLIPDHDADDLYQEGRLAWLLAKDTYRLDGGASRATYIGRVVTNHLRSLARAERALKRGAGKQALSLDIPMGEDGGSLAELLSDVDPRPDELAEHDDLLARLARVRERLLGRERRVFEALADDRPRARLARDLGIHRSTLDADIERIREVARDEGLEDFLR